MTIHKGTIYLVPVPIGNLSDITLRAIDILKSVDFVIAEDTRYSLKLLTHLGIKKKLISYYQPKEEAKAATILSRLLPGKSAALITDSGTPIISDPGFILVKKAIKDNFKVIPLPGASACLPAITSSGIRGDQFLFMGFLSKKPSQVKKALEQIKELPYTMIFYESPRRIYTFMKIALEILNDRKFSLAKELTKLNEKIIRGNLKAYQAILNKETVLGEMVVIIEGYNQNKNTGKIKIETLEDIYHHFKAEYNIPKNQIKDIIQKRK